MNSNKLGWAEPDEGPESTLERVNNEVFGRMHDRVPFIVTMPGGKSFAGGRETSVDEWQREFGDQIEEEQADGRTVFGVDFRTELEHPHGPIS